MSLIIAVYVSDGIVFASDRRLSVNSTEDKEDVKEVRLGSHFFDTTDKTFLASNNVAISTCGVSNIANKTITGYINNMIMTRITKDTPIEDVPYIIIDYFNQFETVPDTNFIIGGYSKKEGAIEQKLYRVNVLKKTLEETDTTKQGALWNGEVFTLARLLLPVAMKKDNGIYEDLPNEEILWNYFSLQDAVDFARFAIETTIKTMSFKKVVKSVGGDIDILVITPEGHKWVQKAELH